MCGRFSLRLNRDEIQNDVDADDWIDEDEYIPRYNIAPRTQAPVIRRRDAPGPSNSGPMDADASLVLHTMKWGLVPSWSKFEDKTLSTTNARSENLVQSGGLWQSIKGKKRCAIPCQGYYEWLTKGKDKIPHFTKRSDGKLLLMAGLYDCVFLEGKHLWTFTIVTTDANPEFSWLHERQPVFLTTKDALDRWLDTSSQTWTPELTKMVQPYSGSVKLQCYQVPKEVGKVGTESPAFIQPIAERKDGIQAMFSKQISKSPTKPANPVGSSSLKRTVDTRTPSPTPSSQHKPHPSPTKRTKVEVRDDQVDTGIPFHGWYLSLIPVLQVSGKPASVDSKKLVSDTNKRTSSKSPSKRKPAKAPAGNTKIEAFFSKT